MGANQVGRKHAGLRKRMGLFARLRSANRAMPAAASDMAVAKRQEARANDLRETLAELAAKEAPPKVLAQELNSRLGEIDRDLDEMKLALLERFDSTSFVSLRAAIPRSVESHRREVISLLDVLLGDRDTLLDRLPRVEYLITILSTEEEDGRRHIVHDPVTLTSALENFSVDTLEPNDADAIAMELYQAAALDSESEAFHDILRTLRARKQIIGLGCLCPAVLRAVVTYNARMFNSVENMAEASRMSDAMLDDEISMLDELNDAKEDSIAEGFIVEQVVDDEPADAEALVDVSDHEASESESIFESAGVDSVIEALRIRIKGGRVGRRGPGERIAVVLDQSLLESIESEAILAETPTKEQEIVSRTSIVGLMLRDLGPLQAPLESLGISQSQLRDDWVRELNDAFSQLLSSMLTDPKAYELTSRLSGIKTKHLLKPLRALNVANRGGADQASSMDVASIEIREATRTAAGGSGPTRGGVRSIRSTGNERGFWLGGYRTKMIAAAALVALAFGLTMANVISIMPSDIKTVKPGALRITSPYLKSAYRNETGRGGLMIGRVDSLFVELSIEGKIKVAEEMIENFEIQGIREAMFYDSRGMMQVHYSAGRLYRPRPGDRATGHAPGESAVRRTLSGQVLDETGSQKADSKGDRDPWATGF